MGLAYAQDELDTSLVTVDTDTISYSLGAYISGDTLVLGRYETIESGSVDSTVIGINAKYVGQSGNGFLAVEGDISALDIDLPNADDGTNIELSATYYYNPNAGLGISYGLSDYRVTEITTFGINFTLFVNPQASIFVGYETSTEKETGFLDIDTDAVAVGGLIRI